MLSDTNIVLQRGRIRQYQNKSIFGNNCLFHVISKIKLETGDIFNVRAFDALSYIYIILILLHHQYGYSWPFLATLLYRPSFSASLQGYILYRHRAVVCRFFAGRPVFARPCEGVHRSKSLMSSSLLLQQCPACLISLTWIVFVMGGMWPYKKSYMLSLLFHSLLHRLFGKHPWLKFPF